MTPPDVKTVYTERLQARRSERDRLARLDHALGNGRLAVFAVGAVLTYLAISPQWFSVAWLLIPILAFAVLLVYHARVGDQKERANRAVKFYESGLRRVEDRWMSSGVSGARFEDSAHPYSGDLDIFGTGSLFERLCTTRTRVGENTLAAWLLNPTTPEVIRARQDAVRELRDRLDLREEMALLGDELPSAVRSAPLEEWGVAPPLLPQPWLSPLAMLLAAINVAGLMFYLLTQNYVPLYSGLIPTALFALIFGRAIRRVAQAVEKPARDLELLSFLLARIEVEPAQSACLQALRDRLQAGDSPPSARIGRLQNRVGWVEAQKNLFVRTVSELLVLRLHLARALERWRQENGASLADWMAVVGEFEALCALAAYAYENPGDPFPDIVEKNICFCAEEMGHPLLPISQAVRNSIEIGGPTRLYIVSGSNMSGKSTLLRAIGVNVVLALAGAPVRAETLRLSVLHVGASLRTQDSLQAGISRFYAEIRRLRQIVEIGSDHPPLLFLLDEILAGTNSHDRRVGAEALARSLVAQGSLGLLTTHDLALAKLGDDPALHAANVHFEDQIENGEMRFDYHLRPGVVEKSNALELMRAVGLDV